MTTPITIAYTPEYLDWKLGPGHPTNPIRAKRAAEGLADWGLSTRMLRPVFDAERTLRLASEVHDPAYVTEVLAGRSGEWAGTQEKLARAASVMFTGTVDLVGAIVADGFAPRVYFNPQGAKHHAHRDHSSGFCVFNDMAWAAQRFTGLGKRVLYVDWDAHHGDGVEALLRNNPAAITASIHDRSIFPGSGLDGHDEDRGAYNWALPAGGGDDELLAAFGEIAWLFHDVSPDVVLLACGADGLAGDPLSTLQYTLGGIFNTAGWLGHLCAAAGVPVLVGGAGGYQPETDTPRAWVETVRAIHGAFDSDPSLTMAEQWTSTRGEAR
jgi:acetoin utilization protein AcuC